MNDSVLPSINEYQAIDVQTGEVKAGGRNTVLSSTAIGSCVAVVALDTKNLVGGIAHIMLPGKAPDNSGHPRTRYVHEGFSALLEAVQGMGGNKENIRICLAGGANVLRDPGDMICCDNMNSVIARCAFYRIPVMARSLGGYLRRRVKLDIGQGLVFCGIGDNADTLLWNASDWEK